jgi:hypothetical protein
LQQTIIDPEGDFVALTNRFGYLVIYAEDHTEQGLQLAGERARIHGVRPYYSYQTPVRPEA